MQSIRLMRVLLCGFACVLAGIASRDEANAQELGELILTPTQLNPIMPLDDIRIGMRGYGLTVFAGTEIEPFAVRVVAVLPDWEAGGRSTFWVICEDPRLDISGPVQGMSGSPIYLWPEGETGEIGEGGLLAGAFAFGFAQVQYCLAGIQPIEQMRAVATRTTDTPHVRRANDRHATDRMLATLLDLQQTHQPHNPTDAARIRLYRQLLGFTPDPQPAAETPPASPNAPQPLLLPMSVGSSDSAAYHQSLMTPLGIAPIAAAGPTIAGTPPVGIDPDTTLLQPGSMVCLSYAWGDLDLSGAGTVTEVLPDGTVLAFGHAMDGIGDTAFPMATGYVHFVVPSRDISFKQSGALRIQGTITRDENSAVGGRAVRAFESAPLEVTVELPDQPVRNYRFQVLHHEQLTPLIASLCISDAIGAVQALPPENTTYFEFTATLSNGRTLTAQSVIPFSNAAAAAGNLTSLLGTVMANPFEPLQLVGLEAHVRVTEDIEITEILGGWLEQTTYRPGDTVVATLQTQGYQQPITTQRVELTLPDDVQPGTYTLDLGGSNNYLNSFIVQNPDLFTVESLDDLFDALNEINRFDATTLYAWITFPRAGVSVQGQRMADLPSSRQALFMNPASTRVMPLMGGVQTLTPTDTVIAGSLSLPFDVVDPAHVDP